MSRNITSWIPASLYSFFYIYFFSVAFIIHLRQHERDITLIIIENAGFRDETQAAPSYSEHTNLTSTVLRTVQITCSHLALGTILAYKFLMRELTSMFDLSSLLNLLTLRLPSLTVQELHDLRPMISNFPKSRIDILPLFIFFFHAFFWNSLVCPSS